MNIIFFTIGFIGEIYHYYPVFNQDLLDDRVCIHYKYNVYS
jgi:hypothetical protein